MFKIFVLYIFLLLAGCTVFQPRYPVKVDRIPEPVLPRPQSFQAIQDVQFSYNNQNIAGRGTLSLDRPNRSLEFTCVTPDGKELLHVRVEDNEPEILFACSAFKEPEGLANAVAIDLFRIYFNNQPENKDDVSRKGDFLLFDLDLGDRAMEYAYISEPPVLVSKRYCGLRGVEDKIDYSDPIEQDGFGCIGKATVKNKLHGYQLLIQTKKITIK